MRHAAALLAFVLAASALGATTKNDDSCDIAVQPAATLLLPYFEVDFHAPPERATQTLFTIQNVSSLPQIAKVTLWTDWGYPVINFPLFLTGYDVQGINLYDIFAKGLIAPPYGTSSDARMPVNPSSGSQPAANTANPNISVDVYCEFPPSRIGSLLPGLQQIFTTGAPDLNYPCGPTVKVGAVHPNAIGYVTVDVFATCLPTLPTSADFWKGLLYDNVLTGDYQQIVPRGDRLTVQGGPLVHIRAVPEGGAAGTTPGTPLPSTFYQRYMNLAPQPTMDRRQPLPSVFAPRFIAGGVGGFNTTFKVWQNGVVQAGAACGAYSADRNLLIAEMMLFDEHENATGTSYGGITIPVGPPPTPVVFTTPINSGGLLPPLGSSGDVGGWLYLNLNRQGWVITSMSAEAINGTDAAATALGNGCSPPVPKGAQIGPTP